MAATASLKSRRRAAFDSPTPTQVRPKSRVAEQKVPFSRIRTPFSRIRSAFSRFSRHVTRFRVPEAVCRVPEPFVAYPIAVFPLNASRMVADAAVARGHRAHCGSLTVAGHAKSQRSSACLASSSSVSSGQCGEALGAHGAITLRHRARSCTSQRYRSRKRGALAGCAEPAFAKPACARGISRL